MATTKGAAETGFDSHRQRNIAGQPRHLNKRNAAKRTEAG